MCIRDRIDFIGSADCSGSIFLTLEFSGTYTTPGGRNESLNAPHLDIMYSNARYSGSAALLDIFLSQGTTIDDFFLGQGISNINNIPVTTFFSSANLFTIYSLSGSTLSFGLDTDSFDGSSSALRHNSLDQNVYTRDGDGPVQTIPNDSPSQTDNSPQIDSPLQSGNQTDARIVGIAFDQGELESFFDFATSLTLFRLVGGGAYVILENGTAIQTSTAPADLNVSQALTGSEVTTLTALDLSNNDIFRPLADGFRFDFTGENNTAGNGGATLRSITFRNDGTFSQSGTSFFTSSPGLDEVNVASSSGNAGTYFISGNTIQLNYSNGDVVRTLFGTDGSNTVIIEQQRYTRR